MFVRLWTVTGLMAPADVRISEIVAAPTFEDAIRLGSQALNAWSRAHSLRELLSVQPHTEEHQQRRVWIDA